MYTIQFSDNFHRFLRADTDEAINEAVRSADLWIPGDYYPDFNTYVDLECLGGGGGPNSGRMVAQHHEIYPHLYATAAQMQEPQGGPVGFSLYHHDFNGWVHDHPGLAYTLADSYCQLLSQEERRDFATGEITPQRPGWEEATVILDTMYLDLL